MLPQCMRWKREQWGCHTHRLRLELRLRRCRRGNRTSRCSRRSGPGSAGTLAGGSSSLPGGEVGCVKQTISSQSDGYRQLRCLLDLRQDEPASQNPPRREIACHPEQSANLSQPALPLSGEKVWRVPANLLLNPWKAFVLLPPSRRPRFLAEPPSNKSGSKTAAAVCRGREPSDLASKLPPSVYLHPSFHHQSHN